MDGQDPHGVVVALGQDRLGHPGPLGRLHGDPVQVLAQVAAGGLAPGPGLVDDEAQPPPHVAGPALGEAELQGPSVPGDAAQQLGRGGPRALVVERPQVGQADPDRIVGRHGVGLVGQVAPASPALPLEPEQVVVAAASSGVRSAETTWR